MSAVSSADGEGDSDVVTGDTIRFTEGVFEGGSFTALVDSIRREGLQNPIVLFEARILDGRQRLKQEREVD